MTQCPVSILFGQHKLPVTADSLVAHSHNATAGFGINVVNLLDPSVEQSIVFRPNDELLSTNLASQLSSSSIHSLCHFTSVTSDGEVNALSTCSPETLTGMFQIGNNFYSLGSTKNGFYLMPMNEGSCVWPKPRRKRRNAQPTYTVPDYYADYIDGQKRYVELAYIADSSVYKKYDSNEIKVRDRLHSIANVVNSFYQPLNIRVTLVWAEIWTDGDKISVVSKSDDTLRDFLAYRKSLMKQFPHDNAQLITDVTFLANVIGKAYKGTMCSYDFSGGIIMDHNPNAASVASTSAHEMGHSFGMEHDPTGCECPSPLCIMAASNGGYTYLSYFSSCSLEHLKKSLDRKMDTCLMNVPKSVYGGAKCGNGVVEDGEDCDCGNLTVCPNKCCIASECKLADKAVCASGDCCDLNTCQPMKKATMCRHPISSCDLPEFCDGDTGECPADFYVQNGLHCPDDKTDYCYDGECGSRDQQCKMIWGPSGYNSITACYARNSYGGGSIYGNCGYDPESNKYTPCEKKNEQCGVLQCHQDTDTPVFGDAVSVHTAYTQVTLTNNTYVKCRVIQTTYSGGKKKRDPGMVKDGAACGKGKMCVDSVCQDMSNVDRGAPQCEPPDCNNKGICNTAGNCHCDYRYGGTSCDIPGYGGSVNSGPAKDDVFNAVLWLVVFLIVLFSVFAGVTYYYHKRKNKWLPAEIWRTTKNMLGIQAIRVPIRKAPAPPGGRRQTNDLNAAWGETPNNVIRVGSRPVYPPSTVTLPAVLSTHPFTNGLTQDSTVPAAPVYSPPTLNNTANRAGRKPQAPGPMFPKPLETRALNPSSRVQGDSSSDENLSPHDVPPPVPPHREVSTPTLKRPSHNAPPPPVAQKPKLPKKPPVSIKPIINNVEPVEDGAKINVKDLAARFDAKKSDVNFN
uniref:Peptidase M12B domain-containing protein n=1 Tax=Panagrellus redivivus TaxID=6233 RepID=A0A7E4VUE9_PANRE